MIQEELNNHILKIILDRPEKLNALNNDLLDKLENSFDKAKQDSHIKGLLLTGMGEKAFCAGADINVLAEANSETGLEFALKGQRIFRKLETLGKPSVAAINGFAFGGGCELAMSAHIRIASPNAKFGQPEVKLGVIPGYGGTQRLSRLIGKGRAIDMCITGKFIDAQTAYDWGLVTDIIEQENLTTKATEILQTILSMGPIAVRKTIDVIDKGFDMELEQAIQYEAEQFSQCCDTEDKLEGTQAFIEKREPNFMDK